MLYNLPAHDMTTGADHRMLELKMLAFAGMLPTSGLATPSPIVATVFFDELHKLELGRKLKAALGSLLELFLQSDPEPATAQPIIAERLGVQLPLAEEDSKALMEEVRRYKWLEAERAGRDIWREKAPEDPEGLALREWFRNHFGAWYLHRLKKPALQRAA